MADGGNRAVDPRQVNLAYRSLLLQTALRQRKNLGTYTYSGPTTRVKLQNVGLVSSLRLFVSAPITIGVAVATPSLKAPWNLINKITLTDFDNTVRMQLSGYQLFVLNSVRRRQPYGYNNQQAYQSGAGIVANPSVPTAVGDATLSFYIDVPIAVNDNKLDGLAQDLTGAIYAQTGLGEMYLSIDWNQTLVSNGNIEAVYSGGATTTVVYNGVDGPAVTVWQNYFLPQNVDDGRGGAFLPIPQIDIMSVYELNGNLRSADNIAVNQEKLISVPNVRRVLGVYANYVNGTTMLTSDLTLLRFLVNGNTVLEEWSQLAQLVEQRLGTEGDLQAGTYWWNFRDHPIETAIYGNVQLGVTPSTVNAGAYWEVAFESLYTKGTALPGMVQAA